jgi:hypothetical protein
MTASERFGDGEPGSDNDLRIALGDRDRGVRGGEMDGMIN